MEVGGNFRKSDPAGGRKSHSDDVLASSHFVFFPLFPEQLALP